MNAAHEEANAKAAAAREAGAVDSAKRVAAADKRLDKKAEEAAKALAEARDSALAEIEVVAADAARAIVAKLTGEQVDEAAARRAVAGALNRA
jgi:F-type H+-transporting ATPase subunit b